MGLIATFLDSLGITDKSKFLSSFTTTIGRKIYTPFDIGVETEKHSLWSQIVICVHEHQHIVQHDREEALFEITYLTDSDSRCRYEIEAYRSNLEINYWRYGKTPNAKQLAQVLENYGCSEVQISIAAQALTLANVSIRQGIVTNEASMVALGYLNTNLEHLKEVKT